MKTVLQHIEHARGKPHHIRKRIVFTAAGAGTMLVALAWLAGSVSTGAFAIRASSFADNSAPAPVITTDAGSDSGSQNLAGAAAALPDANTPAHIEIVNTATSAPARPQAEQTTIPF